MQTITFICTLPNGIHARPASEIEQRTQAFSSAMTLVNNTKGTRANAKSVLSLVAADITAGDNCVLQIDGCDERVATVALAPFFRSELEHCDTALQHPVTADRQPLPVFIEHAQPRYVRGTGVSTGIACGVPVHIDSPDLLHIASLEPGQDEDEQRHDLIRALDQTLLAYQSAISEMEEEAGAVLNAQYRLLADSEYRDTLLNRHAARNALHAVVLCTDTLCQPLKQSSSQYLRERVLDLQDIALRLASYLTVKVSEQSATLTQDSIVISQGLLTPGQFLKLRNGHLKGIVMGDGGETSHTVILARSFGIPLLCGVNDSESLTRQAERLMLDTRTGILIADPDEQMARWFRLETEKEQRIAARGEPLRQHKVTTRDGTVISVSANIAVAAEAERAFLLGADGIGLFRTEMLFCDREAPPNEEEQYQAYHHAIRCAEGKKVIIRTLDIGGDKPCDYLHLPEEENPFLGYRAVRLYPQHMDIFNTQVRALLRASSAGPLHIMVPMVATLAEVKWLHQQFHRIAAELTVERQATGEWFLGIMVEVPSTLYLLNRLSPWLDFVSVGSNDLVQYFLACDRGNANVRHLYNYRDPAFLALMKDIIRRCKESGLSVSLCGEMASDPLVLPLLIGMGLDQLSMSAGTVTQCKERLASLSFQECQALSEQALFCDDAESVMQLLHTVQTTQPLPVLSPDLVLLEKDVANKEEAIKLLTDNLEIHQRVSSGTSAERAIWEREAVFSTALGFSVAVPHCKSDQVSHSSVSLLRPTSPVLWGDGVEVRLILMLTVNDGEQSSHMHIFSRLARKLMHQSFRDQLTTLADPGSITALLQTELSL